jgi:hypothetical protein
MQDRDRDEYGEPRTRSRGNSGVVIAAAVVLLLAAVGGAVWYFFGGETSAEVAAKYRSRFADVRSKLKRVAGELPPAGSVAGDTLPANLDPKPVYDIRNKTFNTGFLMAEHCLDPDRELKSPAEFNLGFHEDEFRTHLRWTGDRNPMADEGRRSAAGDLATRFERSLGLPYLVVARAVRYDPPRAVGDKNFIGGELDLEVFLVDLPAEKVLGGFRRSFRPDPNVMVSFRKDRSQSDSVADWVHSNVWVKARAEVTATLARATGGTFATER